MRKILRFTAILVLVFSIFIPQSLALNVQLNVPSEAQERTNWCWAAASVSIARYRNKTFTSSSGFYGVPVTQSSHVSCATGLYGSASEVPRTFPDIKDDFGRLYGFNPRSYAGYFSAIEVASHLNTLSGNPLYIGLEGPAFAHIVLIVGIHDYSKYQLQILDPGDGSKTWYDYEDVRDFYLHIGGWKETMYNF